LSISTYLGTSETEERLGSYETLYKAPLFSTQEEQIRDPLVKTYTLLYILF